MGGRFRGVKYFRFRLNRLKSRRQVAGVEKKVSVSSHIRGSNDIFDDSRKEVRKFLLVSAHISLNSLKHNFFYFVHMLQNHVHQRVHYFC